jgi:hypothetical protein
VKKIDYYAVQHPWRMPKWLGATIGGIFGFILIVSGVAIVKLTRSPVVPVAAVAAIGSAPSLSAPAATAPVGTAPVAKPAAAVAPAAAPAQPVAEADAATGKHHKHHSSSHHAAKAVAANKHVKSSGSGVVLANAKHDNRKLKEKDALDKLLGL